MRRARNGGTCARCGDSRRAGLYWENAPVVLDLSDAGGPIYEPDMMTPVRCDSCECYERVHQDYRDDPAFAQAIYCAATPEDALRLLRASGHYDGPVR